MSRIQTRDAKVVHSCNVNNYKGTQAASEVQQLIFKYEKESASLTFKERQLNQELICHKQKQLADYKQAINTQAQQEDARMTSDVVTQVNMAI